MIRKFVSTLVFVSLSFATSASAAWMEKECYLNDGEECQGCNSVVIRRDDETKKFSVHFTNRSMPDPRVTYLLDQKGKRLRDGGLKYSGRPSNSEYYDKSGKVTVWLSADQKSVEVDVFFKPWIEEIGEYGECYDWTPVQR